MSDRPILVFCGDDEIVRADIEAALRVQMKSPDVVLVNACDIAHCQPQRMQKLIETVLIDESASIPPDNVQHLRKKLRIRY